MPENEFEKQVKMKIDEFKLRPSEPVWPNIAEEIRDKKRRRLLVLIPLLAILLAGGFFAWHSFNSSNKTTASEKNSTTGNNKNDLSVSDKKQEEIKHTINDDDDSKVTDESVVKKDIKTNDSDNKMNVDVAVDKKNNSSKEIVANEKGDLSNRRQINTDKNKSFVALQKKKANKVQVKEETEIVHSPNKTISKTDTELSGNETANAINVDADKSERFQIDNNKVMIASALSDNDQQKTIAENKLVIPVLPALHTEHDLKSTGKIKWGINFSAGGSSRFDRAFGVVKTEKTASQSFGAPALGTGNVTAGLLVIPPSEVKPGAGFTAGVNVEIPFSKRISISSGLQYVYASDRISIGKTIDPGTNLGLQNRDYSLDGATQTSYAGMQSRNYTNQYHFIQLPVMVHYNLGKKWKTPIIWNAGAAVSRLVSSNVLLYDVAWGGIYYRGEKDVVKTQFSVATGFSIRLTGNNGWQWNIGPQVSMNTGKLFTNTYEKSKHLASGGLNVRLLFPGKKKR